MLVAISDKSKLHQFLCMCVIILVFSSCTTNGSSEWSNVVWPAAITTHNIELASDSVLELLQIHEVFTPKGVNFAQLAASEGLVYFTGSTTNTGDYSINVIEGRTGKQLWQGPETDALSITDETIILGEGNTVSAYVPFTWSQEWSTSLPFARNIVYVYAFDDILQIYASPGYFYIVNKTSGEILERSSNPDMFPVSPHWLLEQVPSFQDNLVLFRSNHKFIPVSSILAVSADTLQSSITQSGDVVWQTADNVISNTVIWNEKVFLITTTDKLQIMDLYTGEIIETADIVPSINFFDPSVDSQAEGYYLAIDNQLNLLYVLLGDSNQLFVFNINE